jgi:hypothetical protein
VFSKTLAKYGQRSALGFSLWLLCLPALAQSPVSSGTTPFIFDGNRMYAELSFVRPDGSIHQALAFVDMGSPSVAVTESLFKELQLDQGSPMVFRVGAMPVRIPDEEVTSDRSPPYSVGSDRKVEAILAGGIMQKYEVVIDYQKRNLTFANPGTLKAEGLPVPFKINRDTGLIAVNASIDGKGYAVTIDSGSAYTWFRQSTARPWLAAHPRWERGVGAVGASNMMMSGDGAEIDGILLRISEISIGSLTLRQVGALAAGPSKGFPGNLELFEWYSTKNALPVIGWLGGNVLNGFRLTIDYPNHIMYWLRQTQSDGGDLDQVGLTLQANNGEYIVAAIAKKNGKPTVENVRPGDKLVRIDGMETKRATWGGIYRAMHGNPGEVRILSLERGTRQITVRARVTSF